jgi:Beta propeller domain
MKASLLAATSAVLITIGLAGCATAPGSNFPFQAVAREVATPSQTMRAFRSEQELASYLRELAERQKRERSLGLLANSLAPPAAKSEFALDGKADEQESVTNVQHAGVDEGGIVKVHGNHLVVLRRGRLFTVSLADGGLEPISSVDAFSPDTDPRWTWYDEMLISGDTVVVIGYSYERGGTEVGLFHITSWGELTYQSTYQLRSNDYYSSRNYASRLIGTKLVFYAPLYINSGNGDPFLNFPAVRKWRKGATRGEFRRIVAASDVYRAEHPIASAYRAALHTVTTCDLSSGGFDCKATSVVGPPGRVFYVSPNSVYIWTTDWVGRGEHRRAESMLYRMPLDGSGPSALRVSGSPVDQFSFLESEDGHLNVLVRSKAAGDGMWDAEGAAGDVALMRVALASFSDGSAAVESSNYQRLPKPEGYVFQNRFVDHYLLYGSGSGWGYPNKLTQSRLFAVRWTDGEQHELSLAHGTDRIEQMGSDAIVVGTDGKDLHFTAVHLGDSPEVADEYTRKNASQAELRSHGFFYKPDGENSGTLGLPISAPGRAGYRHLFESSAAILFLRNASAHFQEMGELGSQPERAMDDKCRASCVDWYGNARPLFVRGRVIALLGYELVEGSLKDGRIEEMRRVSYAPENLAKNRGRQGLQGKK